MKAQELVKELEESILSNDDVAIRVVDPTSELNGRIFVLQRVSSLFDHHEDGSTTAWIEVKEF